MTAAAHEVNFDGLVGPTHNYAGLSIGNLASQQHGQTISNPKAAALQGLAKMKRLAELGLRQAVLPPHDRPDMELLRRHGYHEVEAAHAEAPHLLAAACSASSMWAANAATVRPSADGGDGKVIFVPANLVSELHRSIEAETTTKVLRAIFHDHDRFKVHDPLPATTELRDEGAANHTRLCTDYGEPGVHLFVWSEQAKRFPGRQSRNACEAIAERFALDPAHVVYAQQNPDAIDAGVFHNDVIAVGNLDLLLYHEDAWVNTAGVIDELRRKFEPLRCVKITRDQLSLSEAVETYLFNSQLVRLPDGSTVLICPEECRGNTMVEQCDGIDMVEYVDVRQSMRNGGGPACLRLRVVLTDDELAAMHPGAVFTDDLHERLSAWIERHYRERLAPDDLADPSLIDESRAALDELTKILGLGPIYRFQHD